MKNNKTILITGSTDGIGLSTARALATLGHKVIIHGRTKAKAEAVAKNLSALAVWGDFSSMEEVVLMSRQVIEVAPDLSVHINNAGILANKYVVTVDYFESTLAVNHLAGYLLTQKLLPLLLKNKSARIVNVSSDLHYRGEINFDDLYMSKSFSGFNAYSNSKLMNVLFTISLASRYNPLELTANSLHPGVIDTKLLRNAFGIEGNSVDSGAETSVFLANDSTIENISGKYFESKKVKTTYSIERDLDFANNLWSVSETLLKKWL